jgi:DNA-binding transcriptional regulator LsrR (DeoR family)
MTKVTPDDEKLDEAARAGWLYFIAGHTQDEIAKILKVSRPTAQRLVSLCLSRRLITFRLEHPISACMEWAERLKERFALSHCDVVPADPSSPSSTAGIAERAATVLEAYLKDTRPNLIALGTGRALRAAVERITPMDCPTHQLVSLVGNISADGSASLFDTVGRLADLTKARHYPMPLPFLMTSTEELKQILNIETIRNVRSLAGKAELRLVGIGQMDEKAQVFIDGFLTRDELHEMMRLGAKGEIVGWAFNENGEILTGGMNRRLTSVPLSVPATALTIALAAGKPKVVALKAALKGRLINGLITDETTAKLLLA